MFASHTLSTLVRARRTVGCLCLHVALWCTDEESSLQALSQHSSLTAGIDSSATMTLKKE